MLLAFAPELESAYGTVANPSPFTWPESLEPVFWVCWFGLLAALVGGAFALRARYRAGDAVRRRQVLWLAYGAMLLPLWLGGGSLLAVALDIENPLDFAGLLILQVWPAVAVAVAVTRHGLYSIDRLFNRTLVYALLTALLVATYAVVSLLAGLVVGGSALTASLATLAAALAFRPLHARVQRAVDHRFARARFDAVRLLRDFLDEVRDGHAEPEDVGQAVALALGDPTAELVFRLPETGAYADRLGHVLEVLPADGRARVVIGRDDRELGVLLHDPALTERPDLLRAVIDAAAVPVELARLRVELRLQLAEVESSRARIAQAGYAERRRIERDLHDGAQQRLVTLGIVLRRIQRSLPRDALAISPALDAAVAEVGAAIADLRTIAAGVRPPRLDEGLAAALADLARGATIPVEVSATADRAPPEVEAAAYFVACEALTNALKHASPTRVVVETARADSTLRLVGRRRRHRRRRRVGRQRPRRHARPRGRPGRDAGHRQPARRGHPHRRGAAVRVVIAEDTVLLREGLAGLLEDAGHEVVGRAGDADALLALVSEHEPDLAVVDVRMPPDYDDEGTRAAAEIRRSHAGTGVLVLSQHIETRHIVELVTDGGGFGYLLKDRVLDVDDFLDAARRVADGGSALDPQVVATLINAPGPVRALGELSPREHEVLALMAEGRTNAGIARRLWLTDKTVESHVRTILMKLGLQVSDDDHRRVLAVLAYLRAIRG